MIEKATEEKSMRDATVPTPDSLDSLKEYIDSLVERQHDYGTCVYAMSMAATAAFNYVASRLGVTGFQASCADLDILRRTRRLDGPFIILKAEDALYPQCDLPKTLGEAMQEWEPWLKERARQLLCSKTNAHPAVVSHWERLSGEAQHPQQP